MLWNDYAIYATNTAAARLGVPSLAQSQLSAQISNRLVQQASAGNPSQLLALKPQDFASLAQMAGVDAALLSQAQLQAATGFVNTATSAAHQQDRLDAALTALQATQTLSEPPQLSAQEMKHQLKSALGLNEKAFSRLDDAQLQVKYDQLAAALQQPGTHQINIGRYSATLTVDGNGQISELQTTKHGMLFDSTVGNRRSHGTVSEAVSHAAHMVQAAAPAAPAPAPAPPPPPPELSPQQMKDELKSMLGLKKKAFKKMSDDDIRAKYNEVMAAMQQPGSHKFKVGKFNVSFTVDDNGQLSNVQAKRKGIFGKIAKMVLTVASFIPIPWIAIPARIISGVIAAVEAVKSKSLLGVISSVASVAVGAAGALAGTAISAAASAVSKVAQTVGDVARGVQAGVNAIKSKNILGVVNAAAGAVGSVAGAIGEGAAAVANTAQKVSDWSQRAMVGAKVVVDIKQGRVMDAIVGGTSLASQLGDEIKDKNGELLPLGQQIKNTTKDLQQYAGYVKDGIGVVKGIAQGDITSALAQGASLANRVDAEVVAPDRQGEQGRVTAGQILGYASSGIAAGQQFASGNIKGGLNQTSALLENVVPQIAPNSGWTESAQRVLDTGADVAGMVSDVRNGRVGAALDKAPEVIESLSWNLSDVGILKPHDAGTPPKAVQNVNQWLGYIGDGYEVVDNVRTGDYNAAAYQVLDMTANMVRDESTADRIRQRAAPVIDAADDLRDAIVRRDGARTVVEAAQFVEALQRALEREQTQARGTAAEQPETVH